MVVRSCDDGVLRKEEVELEEGGRFDGEVQRFGEESGGIGNGLF